MRAEKSNLELFKEALNEALDNKFHHEMESCTEEIITSEHHKDAMKAILNGIYEKPSVWKFTRTKIAAILVAVALLLGGCALAYRNEIRDFVKEIYDKYIKVTYSGEDTAGKTIDEIYELAYVPKGYFLKNTNITPIITSYEFTNANGDIIIFEQRALDGANLYFDMESGYDIISDINTTNVYQKNTTNYHYYIWNDGFYSLKLQSSIPITVENLQLILDGIQAK